MVSFDCKNMVSGMNFFGGKDLEGASTQIADKQIIIMEGDPRQDIYIIRKKETHP